jgi:hypothetical protein
MVRHHRHGSGNQQSRGNQNACLRFHNKKYLQDFELEYYQ